MHTHVPGVLFSISTVITRISWSSTAVATPTALTVNTVSHSWLVDICTYRRVYVYSHLGMQCKIVVKGTHRSDFI